MPVHARHLHLVVEVSAVAQTTHKQLCAALPRGVDHEVVEGDDIDIGGALGQKFEQRLANKVRALVE
ncbi:hypothetical protein D3C71_2088510 [compost metagenome]